LDILFDINRLYAKAEGKRRTPLREAGVL